MTGEAICEMPPRAEVQKLFDARTRYGVKSNAIFEPGSPLVAEDLDGGAPEKTRFTREDLVSIIDEVLRARRARVNRARRSRREIGGCSVRERRWPTLAEFRIVGQV